jgi:hypothetical protein
MKQSSGESRRENVVACRDVIARSDSDQAIQNLSPERCWIASLALAMTVFPRSREGYDGILDSVASPLRAALSLRVAPA